MAGGGWISVADNPPEIGKGHYVCVIACDDSGNVSEMRLEANIYASTEHHRRPKWKHAWGRLASCPPVWWMPMPAPPADPGPAKGRRKGKGGGDA